MVVIKTLFLYTAVIGLIILLLSQIYKWHKSLSKLEVLYLVFV